MNTQPPSLILGFALLISGGCAVGPDYTRPIVPEQPKWTEPPPAKQAKTLPTQWWTIFDDTTLDALQRQAVFANQDLKRAVARVGEARALAGISRSQMYPSLSSTGAYTTQRLSEHAADAPQTIPGGSAPDYTVQEHHVSLDASYEVDVWGRVRRLVEAETADVRASETDLQVVLLTLTADVARTYYQLQAYAAEQRILQATVSLRRDTVHLMETRHQAGIINEVDVTRARTELANVESELHAVQRDQARIAHALAVLCGQTVGDFNANLAAAPMPVPEIPVGLPSSLLERRPDIVAAEQRLQAANARIGVAKAAFFPTIRLTGMAGAASEDLGNLLEWPSRIWSLAPSISVPLLDGGRNNANLAAAEARVEQATATYRSTILTALRDVEDALSDGATLKAQHDAVARSLASARTTVVLANERYQQGLSSYLEVVDAERGSLQAERQEVTVRCQRVLATILLAKALGGGWERLDISQRGDAVVSDVTTPNLNPGEAP